MFKFKILFFFFLLVIQLLNFNYATSIDHYCKDIAADSAILRLKRYLLCDYEPEIRPIKNHNGTIKLTFVMFVKHIEMMQNQIVVHNWLLLEWKDEFLTWKPEDFGDINILPIESEEIWMPDLALFNGVYTASPTVINPTTCIVTNNGEVSCVIPNSNEAICVQSNARWPYNHQQCDLQFGSWSHIGEEVSFRQPIFSLSEYTPNNEWELKNVSIKLNVGKYNCCPNETFPSIEIMFTLYHHSAIDAATLIIPAIVLTLINIIATFLQPNDALRTYLIAANIYFHVNYLESIMNHVSENGAECPSIILFFRDSFVITLVNLSMTLLIKILLITKCTSPAWLSSMVQIIVSNKIGQIILLNNTDPKNIAEITENSIEEGGNLVSTSDNKASSNWILVGKLLDKILIFLYVLIYGIMMERLLPTKEI